MMQFSHGPCGKTTSRGRSFAVDPPGCELKNIGGDDDDGGASCQTRPPKPEDSKPKDRKVKMALWEVTALDCHNRPHKWFVLAWDAQQAAEVGYSICGPVTQVVWLRDYVWISGAMVPRILQALSKEV